MTTQISNGFLASVIRTRWTAFNCWPAPADLIFGILFARENQGGDWGKGPLQVLCLVRSAYMCFLVGTKKDVVSVCLLSP